MQPVIVLMSSYLKRRRRSFKSSMILKKAEYMESDFSTCIVGYEYKRVYSCHSSSSIWFYIQPGITLQYDQLRFVAQIPKYFDEPSWWYIFGRRRRNCNQNRGCMGPLEDPTPAPVKFKFCWALWDS